ncbi:WhiB family transcriptional regulator [Kitasatospora aureofaciens]|uniref:WhiB family transcriptional regulator n=1 Tax=Kitasatospora aureofaciens TaxID=1894 RepID=UPI001E086732|nr:WhiB family transcriptional regulator [Kitasatospora aureofaciens]HJD84154.1 WhiB family transcriptional regulator [Kitasatospora aureofaciens]
MIRRLYLTGTRVPHHTARPLATRLAEYRPNPDGNLPGAACADADSDLFYPEPDQDTEIAEDTAAAAWWAERRAKMICAGCPVRTMCLGLALERREPFGIFGGLNEHERASLLRKAARSRDRVNTGSAA